MSEDNGEKKVMQAMHIDNTFTRLKKDTLAGAADPEDDNDSITKAVGLMSSYVQFLQIQLYGWADPVVVRAETRTAVKAMRRGMKQMDGAPQRKMVSYLLDAISEASEECIKVAHKQAQEQVPDGASITDNYRVSFRPAVLAISFAYPVCDALTDDELIASITTGEPNKEAVEYITHSLETAYPQHVDSTIKNMFGMHASSAVMQVSRSLACDRNLNPKDPS